jgi:uncharacterized membrane protein YphA (DoxX/SURF4 family)
VTRAVRVLLGLAFLAAGALKALDPVQAALAVDAYDLLPPSLALVAGLWLPGLEVAAGAALLAGFLARGGAALAALLSAGFLLFVLQARHRGLDVSCGCFGPLGEGLGAGWRTIVLDSALLAAALFSWWRTGGPGAGGPTAPRA